jgi:hypothetical protein
MFADLLVVRGDPLAKIEDVAAVRSVMVSGNLATVEELMKPFAGRGGAPLHSTSGVTGTMTARYGSRMTGTSGARRSSQNGFWWHGADYVESSRGACCANHFTSLPGRSAFTCSSVSES